MPENRERGVGPGLGEKEGQPEPPLVLLEKVRAIRSRLEPAAEDPEDVAHPRVAGQRLPRPLQLRILRGTAEQVAEDDIPRRRALARDEPVDRGNRNPARPLRQRHGARPPLDRRRRGGGLPERAGGRSEAFGRTGKRGDMDREDNPTRHELLSRGNHPRRRTPRLADEGAREHLRELRPRRGGRRRRLRAGRPPDARRRGRRLPRPRDRPRRPPVAARAGHDARAGRRGGGPRRVPRPGPDAPRGPRALRLGRPVPRGAEARPLAPPRPPGVPRRRAPRPDARPRPGGRPSFSADMLRRIKEHEPRVETCLNFDATAYRPTGRFWPDLPKGCETIAAERGARAPGG